MKMKMPQPPEPFDDESDDVLPADLLDLENLSYDVNGIKTSPPQLESYHSSLLSPCSPSKARRMRQANEHLREEMGVVDQHHPHHHLVAAVDHPNHHNPKAAAQARAQAIVRLATTVDEVGVHTVDYSASRVQAHQKSTLKIAPRLYTPRMYLFVMWVVSLDARTCTTPEGLTPLQMGPTAH